MPRCSDSGVLWPGALTVRVVLWTDEPYRGALTAVCSGQVNHTRCSGSGVVLCPGAEPYRGALTAVLCSGQVLNRTEVTREERRWAELDYLRRFGPAWREAGGRLPAADRGDAWRTFLETHPRYPAICDGTLRARLRYSVSFPAPYSNLNRSKVGTADWQKGIPVSDARPSYD